MHPQHFSFGKAVRISWEDSATVDGWKNVPCVDIGDIESVGYVIATDKRGIAISTSVTDQAGFIDPLSIPWGAIVRIKELDETTEHSDGSNRGMDEEAHSAASGSLDILVEG